MPRVCMWTAQERVVRHGQATSTRSHKNKVGEVIYACLLPAPGPSWDLARDSLLVCALAGHEHTPVSWVSVLI